MRHVKRLIVLCGIFPVMYVTCLDIRLNTSPSVPIGVYAMRHLPPVLSRGLLVVLPVPVSVRTWHGSIPVLTPVAGLPGDLACAFSQRLILVPMRHESAENGSRGKRMPAYDDGVIDEAWRGKPLPVGVHAETCPHSIGFSGRGYSRSSKTS